MPDISILISSLRTRMATDLIQKINRIPCPYSYEIIYVGPHPIHLPNVQFVCDDVLMGSIMAYNAAYKYATGHYIITVPDGVSPPPNFFSIVDKLEEKCKNNPIKISGFVSGDGRTFPLVQQDWFSSQYKLVNPECPGNIIRFPVGTKASIDKYLSGYIFNPYFFHHAADNFLGIFLAMIGGVSEEIQEVCLQFVNHASLNTYDMYDRLVLLNLLHDMRWDSLSYISRPSAYERLVPLLSPVLERTRRSLGY